MTRLVLLLLALGVSLAANPAKTVKFPTAKYDFQPPFVERGKAARLENWVAQGHTQFDTKGIKLTRGPNQKGALWNNVPLTWGSWEVEFDFVVTGTLPEGGEGFAFWFVQVAGVSGNIFGNKDKFRGLAVIFDSKDNDKNHNNPSVAAHNYDGTLPFNHDDDGVADQLAGCVADYRNRGEAVSVRITFRRATRKLEVYLDLSNRGKFQRCLSVGGVEIDRDYFIGFTAESDASGDTHEIRHFKIKDMSTNRGDDTSRPSPGPQQLGAKPTKVPPPPVAPHIASPAKKLQKDIATAQATAAEPSLTAEALDGKLQAAFDKFQASISAKLEQQKHLAAPVQKDGKAVVQQPLPMNELRSEFGKLGERVTKHVTATAKTVQDKLEESKRSLLSGAEERLAELREAKEALKHTKMTVDELQTWLASQMRGIMSVQEALQKKVHDMEAKALSAKHVEKLETRIVSQERENEKRQGVVLKAVDSNAAGWGLTMLVGFAALVSTAALVTNLMMVMRTRQRDAKMY